MYLDCNFLMSWYLISGCWDCGEFDVLLREKKRERERDDLWRKMQDLSLKNAAKEGISLGTGID